MAEMIYERIEYVEKKMSRIFYGTASERMSNGENSDEIFDAMYQLGINAFDTARIYQKSERVLGDWIERRELRDKVVILSKCAHPLSDGTRRVNSEGILEDLETSLEQLKTKYIDIYLLHRDDPNVPVDEIVETLNELHSEGKIGAFGGSNWTRERIEEANEYAYQESLIPFTVSSPNYGLAEQLQDPWGGGCVGLSGVAHRRDREWYEKENMAIVAYSSLGRGLFSGKMKYADVSRAHEFLDEYAMKGYGHPENYERLRRAEEIAKMKGCSVPQIAMAWLYNQKLNTFAVVSTQSAARMQENIDALHIELSMEEMRYLEM